MEISQNHHDTLSKAVLDRDFDAFAACMAIPHTVTTAADTHTVTSLEQMAEIFKKHSAKIRSQGVTAFIRTVKRAEFIAADLIIAEHESHLMRGGTRVVRPYPSRTWLRCINSRWLEFHAANGILNMAGDFDTVTKPAAVPTIPDLPNDLREALAR